MTNTLRFVAVGLLIAGLEEFITQGVLKHTYTAWFLPTLVAFIPFLLLLRLIGWCLDKTLSESAALLIYYLVAGAIGLSVEWFLIGLSPWRDPQAPIIATTLFQFGMFSFWAGVAFVPRLLCDQRPAVAKIRNRCRLFLIFAMTVIYLLTFLAPKAIQFPVAIVAVLLTFLALNFFYWKYGQILSTNSVV